VVVRGVTAPTMGASAARLSGAGVVGLRAGVLGQDGVNEEDAFKVRGMGIINPQTHPLQPLHFKVPQGHTIVGVHAVKITVCSEMIAAATAGGFTHGETVLRTARPAEGAPGLVILSPAVAA